MKLLLSIWIFLITTLPMKAHEGEAHITEEARLIGQEVLTISIIPVTDSHEQTEGFLDRFQSSGPLILSFTYTDCETICPLTNAILSAVDGEISENVTIVSVSIDPAKDTPDALRETAKSWNASENWVWLTAKPRENYQLLEELGVDVATLETHDPVFLVGDLCSKKFTRIIGLPEPSALVELAQKQPICEN